MVGAWGFIAGSWGVFVGFRVSGLGPFRGSGRFGV